MKLIVLSLVFFLLNLVTYAEKPSPDIEKNLLTNLSSSDVHEVAKALGVIHDKSFVSVAILSTIADLLHDPRPAWRSGGDVIISVKWLAYRAMKRITEFKPSQPSIHHDAILVELEDFIQKKYPASFGSKYFNSKGSGGENE